jgi:hypothetical protein
MAGLKLLDRLLHRRRPADPGVFRYVYLVAVDGERDDKLLIRDEPVTVEAHVPFRGRTVVVERIEELHARDASGDDLGEQLESRPEVQIARTLICRELAPASD